MIGAIEPCLEIVFRDWRENHTHKISAGHSDVIHVYREGNETFVLSVNEPLGYAGLEVFDGDDTLPPVNSRSFLDAEWAGSQDSHLFL